MRFTDGAALASTIPEPIIPLVRTFHYAARGTRAKLRARLKPMLAPGDMAPIFIIGCGRSGTTLLGDLFAMHPRVSYIYEPYDLWAAIDPVTDFLQLYSRGDYHCLLDARSVTSAAKNRFQRLMSPRPGLTLVEKSPINSLRIGFLEALVPNARFVHIIRDGVNVAHSIAHMAGMAKRMAFRPSLNDWWGVGDAKWTALEQDGRAAGYYPDEVHHLITGAQRGAYEWLLSVREINAWRAHLGSRLIELRLDDLIADPRKTVKSVIDAPSISLCGGEWLDQAIRKVRQVTIDYNKELALPGQMQVDFNNFQESYGFKSRATVICHNRWAGNDIVRLMRKSS